MHINSRLFRRPSLSKEQQGFLQTLIPFARLTRQFIVEKATVLGIPTLRGLPVSLLAGDMILKSDWGTHPIAEKASNLTRLEINDFWEGKAFTHQGRQYRIYDSWLDFVIDLTDEYTFQQRKTFEPILLTKDPGEQIKKFTALQHDYTEYGSKIEEVIGDYGLFEFDY